ncbi:fimbria/pilus chaperone family protein [Pseudomonas tolaasii]|uniref:P pilus assembly chaperone PapD n=2 Tax=Pseudomonas tolaasii TaxID=29442 RepID=A0ABX4QC59_PSETO|nr:P pilus assembly chaperone PapD [Pseudomonas tolaasii NCPPB 2192]
MRGLSIISNALSGYLGTCVLLAAVAVADGMLPETTVVVLYEEDGEATLNIKNTDAGPALLHSVVENIPEDPEPLLIVTPPITRVEAGDTQLVRFISTLKTPLKTQRLKRVSFEGIPQARAAGGATIGITLRQNLPLILHPQGLPRHHTPWELLKWKRAGERLTVHNDSAYVVRLAPDVQLLPQRALAMLPRTYILPGETLAAKADSPLGSVTEVEIQPATVYGFSVDHYRAPINADEG